MKLKYEQKLALKLTSFLILIFLLSFGIFIFLNYKISFEKEKAEFINNFKSVPLNYIINLIEWKRPNYWKWAWNTTYKKIFRNVYIKIWNKEFIRWFFVDKKIKNNIISNLENKQIKDFGFLNERILAYKIKNEKITLVIWKDISYIFDSIHRLICIALFITIFSSIILYFFSLRLAYKTTKNIRKANKKLKEYNYNLAHELKTPLSVIKSNLELLEMFWKIDFETINSCKWEINSMQEIIDSLLFLSENEINIKKDKLLLKKEIEKIIEKYFNKNSKKIILNIDNKLKIKFNKKLFNILIKNLIENALKYWEKTSKIEIIFDNKLIIKNKISTNLKLEDPSKLFETFYKWDNSRVTNWFWLWLNIVKKIIDLHNYKIKLKIENNYFIVKLKLI